MISSGSIITGPFNILCLRALNARSIGSINAASRVLAQYSVKTDSEAVRMHLQDLSHKENAIILKILSLKEIAYDIPLYGSSRNLNGNSCRTIEDYAKTEYALYRELENVRNEKKRHLAATHPL